MAKGGGVGERGPTKLVNSRAHGSNLCRGRSASGPVMPRGCSVRARPGVNPAVALDVAHIGA